MGRTSPWPSGRSGSGRVPSQSGGAKGEIVVVVVGGAVVVVAATVVVVVAVAGGGSVDVGAAVAGTVVDGALSVVDPEHPPRSMTAKTIGISRFTAPTLPRIGTEAATARYALVVNAKQRARRDRPVIGWREWVALPDLGVDGVKAKVDSGARSSSLHAYGLEEFERDGRPWVRFEIHPLQRTSRMGVVAEAELHERRIVRNPGGGGREELRPVIVTMLELAGQRWPIELTLTRRDAMGFRMLLGRQAVRRRFVIDPGRSFVTGKRTGRNKQ